MSRVVKVAAPQRSATVQPKSDSAQSAAFRMATASAQLREYAHDFGSVAVRWPLTAGEPLDAGIRSRFEPCFGESLSDVRIHIDSGAARAAVALHANAFAFGRDIVFNTARYRPESFEGARLLAHELAHVVQQRSTRSTESTPRISEPGDEAEREAQGAASAQLAGSPAQLSRGSQPVTIQRDVLGAALSGIKPETIVRQWLEHHQFAPPESQPERGERHVLLNGEDMTVSEAVKLGAAALSQPPQLVNAVITAALAEPIRTSAAGLPFIGKGNEIPGIDLTKRDAFGMNPAIMRTVELSSIDDFLTEHRFAAPEIRDPTGDRALLDGNETTVEHIADRAMAILGQYPILNRADVLAHIRQKYVAARGGPVTQMVFGYTLVPKFAQRVGGPADPNNPLITQHQFSFTITREHHAGDSPGLETSFQGSVALSDRGIVNVQAGGQEAIVLPLLRGWIQVSGLVQLMVSENWSKTVTGSTVIAPAFQATGGAQIQLTPALRGGPFAFLNGHAQLGLQVLAGSQTTAQGTVGVASAGLVINIPFSL